MQKQLLAGIAALALTGCSQQPLSTEAKLLGGALVGTAIVEGSKVDNYGLTHGVISYGLSSAVERFADQAFPHPEQRWAADMLAITGAALPALYYYHREPKDTLDSQADYLLPVGNMLWVAYRRLQRGEP